MIHPIVIAQQDIAGVLIRGTRRVPKLDDHVRQLLDDLEATMRAAGGVGLAAPQIGVALRVAVANLEGRVLRLVNPELVLPRCRGETIEQEGCLSLPNSVATVPSWDRVVVKGWNQHGHEARWDVRGGNARIVRHEVDHLDGILCTARHVGPLEVDRPVELVHA